MTKTMSRIRFAHDEYCEAFAYFDTRQDVPCDCAVREMRWIGQEARSLMTATDLPDQQRFDAFVARKMALLEYISATR